MFAAEIGLGPDKVSIVSISHLVVMYGKHTVYSMTEEKAWLLVGFLKVDPGELLAGKRIFVCPPWTV